MTKLFKMVKRNVLKWYYKLLSKRCAKKAKKYSKKAKFDKAMYWFEKSFDYIGKSSSVWMS